MKKIYNLRNLYLILVLCLTTASVYAQLGKLDTLYYGGKGVDFKCTGGVVLPDSSVIITGKFPFVNERLINGIAKLTKDGEIDYSFNVGSGADEHVNVVIRQPDGKLIIGGDFVTFNGQLKNRITRLNSDGSLDGSFTSGTGVDGSVYAIYLQSDGKIVLGGDFLTFNGDSVGGIVRLNSDGTHDFSFSSNIGFDGPVYSVDRYANKNFIIGGLFNTYNDSAVGCLARLDSNGIFDNTFNVGGAGANNIITNATILPNGKIIAAGFFGNYNGTPATRVARINADGSLDNTFVTGAGFNNNVNELVVQPDGKILFTGNFTQYKGANINRIVRIDTTGNRDMTFAPGSGANFSCNAVFLNADGKIYLGGTFIQIDSFARIRFARLLNDGKVDQSFWLDSKLNGQVNSIAFQSSGKAIIGGGFNKYNTVSANRIARLNLDGSLDSTFLSSVASNNAVRSVVVLPDDKILVGGDFTSYSGVTVGCLVKLNADGSRDTSFIPGAGANNSIYSITPLSNGKILITGSFTQYGSTPINRIARLNSNGTLDNSFIVGTGFPALAREAAIQADGKIIVVGSFTTYDGATANRIVRLDTTGVRDVTFTTGTGANNVLNAIALQPDGKAIIGGTLTAYNGVTANRIARLNTDGTHDNTYIASCGTQINEIFPVFGSSFFQGGMLVAGTFTTVNGEARNRIVLLDNTGNIDSINYFIGDGAESTVNVMADNKYERKLFVGGDFRAFQNHIANRLATLQNGYIRVENLDNALCPGGSTKIYFRKDETFFGNNVFTVQISDSAGSFTNGVNIGSQNSVDIGADSISILIPANTPNGSGYRFRIVSSNPNDTSNITFPVEISSSATATITTNDPTSFCEGGSATLIASNGDQFLWSNGETTQAITVTNSSSYSTTVTTAGCAAVSNTINVTVSPSPDSSISIISTTICNGGTATLQAASSLSYLWSTNETDSVIQVTQSGSYTVTVSNGMCYADSTIAVNLSSSANLITALNPTVFCQGDSTVLTSQPGLSYSWSTGATTQSITVTSQGNFDVTVNDGTCTDTSAVISITMNSLPNVQIAQLSEICINISPQVVLTAGSPSGGVYSGSVFISNDTLYAFNAWSSSMDSIYIIYTYTDNNSCTTADTALQVLDICGSVEEVYSNFLIVPNPAHTHVTVSSTGKAIPNLTIFNVLGEQVYAQPNVKSSSTTIDVGGFRSGLYIVLIGETKMRFMKAD